MKTQDTAAATTSSTHWTGAAGSGTLVIFDSGHDACLRRLPITTRVHLGDQLLFAGTRWQITAHRLHSKAFVAEPLSQ